RADRQIEPHRGEAPVDADRERLASERPRELGDGEPRSGNRRACEICHREARRQGAVAGELQSLERGETAADFGPKEFDYGKRPSTLAHVNGRSIRRSLGSRALRSPKRGLRERT